MKKRSITRIQLLIFGLLVLAILILVVPGLKEEFFRYASANIEESLQAIPLPDGLGSVLWTIAGLFGAFLVFYECIFYFWHFFFRTTDPPTIGTILSLLIAGAAFYFLGAMALGLGLILVGLHALWMLSVFMQEWGNERKSLELGKQLEQALNGQVPLRIKTIGMSKDKETSYPILGVDAEFDAKFTELLMHSACDNLESLQTSWKHFDFGKDWAYLVLEIQLDTNEKKLLALYIGAPQQMIRIGGIHQIYSDELPITGFGRRRSLAAFLELLESSRELCIFPVVKGKSGKGTNGLRIRIPDLPQWRSYFAEKDFDWQPKTGWSTTYLDPSDRLQ